MGDKEVYFAKLAEQAERYDEMANHMENVGKLPDELSVEERNLLSVAYKNAVGSGRAAWRIITSVEQKEKTKGNEDQAKYAKEYCTKVEGELQKICDTILGLLDGNARLAYEEASKVAEKDLAVTHPIRLGLALNYSVFQYEVLSNPEEACKMARTAFEDAIAELDNVA